MEENMTGATETTEEVGAENQKVNEKTYTQAELEDLLARESDRKVTKALAKQKREYEKKLSLSGLDENQRAVAEKDNTIAELQEQLKEFKTLQNKNEVIKVLNARGLSATFADLISIDDDVEAAQKRIDALDNLFKKAVQDEVKRRLASPAPKVGVSDGENTADSFKKMTLRQKQELYTSNPELYKKVAK